jgi:hypothetical protein
MSALIAAQGESGVSSTATSPSAALQDLFSQIDANGDGAITRTEFENTLGAGGTNTAAADKVFGQLDTNGDGSVSLDEMKSALQGAGGHHGGHGHHMTPAASTTSSDNSSATLSYNLIEQLIQRQAQALSASVASSLSMNI